MFSIMTEIEIRAFEEDEVNKVEKEEIVNIFLFSLLLAMICDKLNFYV